MNKSKLNVAESEFIDTITYSIKANIFPLDNFAIATFFNNCPKLKRLNLNVTYHNCKFLADNYVYLNIDNNSVVYDVNGNKFDINGFDYQDYFEYVSKLILLNNFKLPNFIHNDTIFDIVNIHVIYLKLKDNYIYIYNILTNTDTRILPGQFRIFTTNFFTVNITQDNIFIKIKIYDKIEHTTTEMTYNILTLEVNNETSD